MTSLYDPSRRRIGTAPALRNNPNWIVPRLTIWPEEVPKTKTTLIAPRSISYEIPVPTIRVSAMIPAEDAGASYLAREVSGTIPAHELPALIAEYYADPENLLETFFGINLNKTTKPRVQQPVKLPSSEDIGI